MIKINSEMYISFSPLDMNMLLSGWEYTEYYLFIIYRKKLNHSL